MTRYQVIYLLHNQIAPQWISVRAESAREATERVREGISTRQHRTHRPKIIHVRRMPVRRFRR